MKDSQQSVRVEFAHDKYIKANNERFSTLGNTTRQLRISISRRIMKDSQLVIPTNADKPKYIKANNERFSTQSTHPHQQS